MNSSRWFNLTLLVTLLGTTALCFIVPSRDRSRPNFEFLPEAQMSEAVGYNSFAPNENFADGLTLRLPPTGTVARGQKPLHYQATPEDALRAGEDLHNPFNLDSASRVARGQVVFQNYCIVCHGPLGEGNGPVTQKGFPRTASLLADRAVQMKDGQMFHILTYGQANMPSFAAQLATDDRWSVILHVRTLQGPYLPSPPTTRFEQTAALFRDNCIACHGIDGAGNQMRKVVPLIPDFSSPAWQMSQTEMALVNQISYGSQPLMPGFRYKLTSDQILGLAVYVRSFAVRQGSGSGLSTPPPTSHLTPKVVYGVYCWNCHAADGKGTPSVRAIDSHLPDFTSVNFQKSRSDADLTHSILAGKGPLMKSRKEELGTVDVKDMVALVRGFESGKQVVDMVMPGEGFPVPEGSGSGSGTGAGAGSGTGVAESEDAAKKLRMAAFIYQHNCINCHGPDGRGSIMRPTLPEIPDFTKANFHQTHGNVQLTNTILKGKGKMPAGGGQPVSPEQAEYLVAYVRAFAPKGLVIPDTDALSDSEFDRSYKRLLEQYKELQKQFEKGKDKP
jgi:mono/diheme cytochrome c family protein